MNCYFVCRNDVWEVLYTISTIRADMTTNMAYDRQFFFVIGQLKKNFSKIIWPN
jgi:hypothetical protein